MSALSFQVVGARAEPYAAVPTLVLRLRIAEEGGARVEAVALRCQLRIEPQRRRHSPAEQDRLLDLFGEPPRWGETVRSILWTHAALMVPAFTGATEIDLPVVCTYDFEVSAAGYLAALDDGDVPLLLLFSGTVFARGSAGLAVDQVPWDREASYRLPVRLWRDVMDSHFPNSAWIRLRRDTFDALRRFKSRQALPTWEDAVEALLRRAEVEELL